MTVLSVWRETVGFFGAVEEKRDRLKALSRQVEAKSQVLVMVRGGTAFAAQADPSLAEDEAELGIVSIRSELRDGLRGLEAALGRMMTERDKYYALFPIVIYVDEVLRSAAGTRAETWESLQSEFYGIDNGGERFFVVLDELIARSETHPVILQVFYHCLNSGFQGQYAAEPTAAATIAAIKERLGARIPLVGVPAPHSESSTHGVDVVPFPWEYYAIAAGAVVGVHLLLRLTAFAAGGLH